MPTLSELIAATSRHPGLYAERFTTGIQASPPSGSYVGVASGVDATRRIVSSDLARLDVSGDGYNHDPSYYRKAYLWLPASGLQRVITDGGYSPNLDASDVTDQSGSDVRVGVLTLSRALGATIAAGTAAEIHRPAPPMFDADGASSLRTYLNRALGVMRTPYRISLTGVSNAYRYSLAAYPWLRHEGDLIRVSDREDQANEDPYVLPGYSSLRFDGAVTYLILEAPVNAGSTFYVDVYRPLNTWINTGGGFASSSVGLVSLTDACLGQTEDIALLAYWYLCNDLATRDAQGTDNQWMLNAQRVASAVAPFLAWGQPSGPRVRGNRAHGGDSPAFLARRQSGAGRRWG